MIEKLIKYWGIMRVSIRERLQFRFDFAMSLFAAAMFAGLYYLLWRAIYAYTPHPVMPWAQLITYTMAGQAINFARFSPAERTPVYRMTYQIREGDIALELIKPVGFMMRRFLEAIGFFLVELLWVNLPLLALGMLLFEVKAPASLTVGLGFLVSLIIAFIIAFALNSIVMVLAFWTTNTFGTQMAKRALVEIASGMLIPFEFFPEWLRVIVNHLPFKGMAYIPLSIYTGKIHGMAIVFSIGEQLLWATAILAVSQCLWWVASRRVTIFGG